MRHRFVQVLVGLSAVVLWVTGCSPGSAPLAWKSESWKSAQPYQAPPPVSDFSPPALPPDAVVLEVAVAQIDEDQREDVLELMQRADTQVIDLPHRKVLDANGVWSGILTSAAVGSLNRLLKDKPIDFSELAPWQAEVLRQQGRTSTSRLILHQRVQLGAGEEHRIPITDVMPQASWVVKSERGERAGQGDHTRGFIKVEIRRGEGDATNVVLAPEIHYGQKQARFGVSQGEFAYESSQPIWGLDELQLELLLRPGETAVMTAALDAGGLGAMLFGPGENGTFVRRLLLIRLAQTPRNDLFDAAGPISRTDGF